MLLSNPIHSLNASKVENDLIKSEATEATIEEFDESAATATVNPESPEPRNGETERQSVLFDSNQPNQTSTSAQEESSMMTE